MGLSEFIKQAHICRYGARVAVELAMRHGMDVGQARELVRSISASIELMYSECLSPALVARKLMLAMQAGTTDPAALAQALNTHTNPHSLVNSVRIAAHVRLSANTEGRGHAETPLPEGRAR